MGLWMYWSMVSFTHILPMHPTAYRSMTTVICLRFFTPNSWYKRANVSTIGRTAAEARLLLVFIENILTDMSVKVIMVFAVLLALLLTSEASSPGEAKDSPALQQLLARRMNVRESAIRQVPEPQAQLRRVQRRTHLSEDERETMTKQIMQAISEVMNSDCMLDRDYQGWVDFGRRQAE